MTGGETDYEIKKEVIGILLKIPDLTFKDERLQKYEGPVYDLATSDDDEGPVHDFATDNVETPKEVKFRGYNHVTIDTDQYILISMANDEDNYSDNTFYKSRNLQKRLDEVYTNFENFDVKYKYIDPPTGNRLAVYYPIMFCSQLVGIFKLVKERYKLHRFIFVDTFNTTIHVYRDSSELSKLFESNDREKQTNNPFTTRMNNIDKLCIERLRDKNVITFKYTITQKTDDPTKNVITFT